MYCAYVVAKDPNVDLEIDYHVSSPFGNQFNYSLKGHLDKVQVSKKGHLNQAHLNINSVRSEV